MSSSNTGLALFLKLDEFVSDKVADSSGNNRSGTLHGAPRLIADDRYGSCLTFDGEYDYVELPQMEIDFSNGLTISACVYFSSFKTWSRIIDMGKAGGTDNIVLSNKDTTNELILTILHGTTPTTLSAPNALARDKWLHVAATVDKNGSASLIVQGKVVATGTVRLPDSLKRDSNFLGKSNRTSTLFHGRLANIRVYNRALTSEALERDMQEDYLARAAFAAAYPLDFDLRDDDDQPVLYIDNNAGHNLHFEVTNASRQAMTFAAPGDAPVGLDNHHLELRFRPNTLSETALRQMAVQDGGWKMSQSPPQPDGTVSLYFLSKTARSIGPGGSTEILLQQVRADGGDGSRGTRVEFKYRQASYSGEVAELTGTRVQHLSIINASGHKIPLHAGFLGGNKILNESNTENRLTLRMTNISEKHPIYLNPASSNPPSEFTIWFDSELGEPDEMNAIIIKPPNGRDWEMNKLIEEQPVKWVIKSKVKTSLDPRKDLDLILSNIRSSKSSGNANLYLHYKNIPGYADGEFVCPIEKGPLVYDEQNVGIGTSPSQGTKVAISNPTTQLQLRREKAERAGGKKLFLELFQDDTDQKTVPEVYPSIRFHHSNRFWHRIEGRPNGVHIKHGDLARDDYCDTFAGNGSFSGRVSVVGSMNIGATASASGLVSNVFEGHLADGETKIFTLYSLEGYDKRGYRSSHVEIVAMMQDRTANTRRLYFKADYGWYREWSNPPVKEVLLEQYSKASGTRIHSIETVASGNDIQLKIGQTKSGYDSIYHIVTRHMVFSI